MSGANKSEEARQRALTQQQIDMGNKAMERSDMDDAARRELMAPAIDFNKTLATGNRDAVTRTLAPMFAEIGSSVKAAKERIYDSIPAGAARDLALADLERNTAMQTSSAKSNLINSSFDKLANIGSGLGSFSLNEFGGSLRAVEGATQTNRGLMDAQNQRKAATLGFLGSMAGAAGGAAQSKFWK